MGGLDLLGYATVAPLHTCERHVNGDFRSLLFAEEGPVKSGLGRCHSTQFNDGKKAKAIAAGAV